MAPSTHADFGQRAIVDVSQFDEELTKLCLLPYMAHPDDDNARERYGAFFLAQCHFAHDLAISNETLGYLVEAARVGVGNDFDKAIPGGCMAGDVLLARLEMDDAQVPHAGIDKACHLASQRYGHRANGANIHQGFLSGDGEFHRASRETVFDNWKKYCRAAHLWAAYLILSREAETMGVRNELSKWLFGRKLASLAMALKSRASTVSVSGNASLPLPANAIEIIGAPIISIKPPVPNLDFWTIISEHRPRKKLAE